MSPAKVMRGLIASTGAAALVSSLLVPTAPSVLPGLDVLRESGGEALKGKRIGLVSNQTGKSIDGVPAVRILRSELGLQLVALFSPEHGFSGEKAAGEPVASGTELASGLPVYSLYGETRKPTAEMLGDIDVLVFDIQDIGVRFYTYISTLKLVMEAAAEADVEVLVLDRPNPLGGIGVEGPVLDPRFQSFVGVAPIPVVHGMTVGELAQLFKGERMLERGVQPRLQVVPARGWRRDMTWEETGLPWRATSPNIRTVEAALHYPAIGLFEGINVSEGRGTRKTFLVAGAPWIESDRWVRALTGRRLPGARFVPESFVPRAIPAAPHPLYQDVKCFGLRLEVSESKQFRAVRTGLTAIAVLRELYADMFRWREQGSVYVIDRLLGSDGPRRQLEAGEDVDDILERLQPDVERFRRRRAPYLLYPD